jgi:hypothetical protein
MHTHTRNILTLTIGYHMFDAPQGHNHITLVYICAIIMDIYLISDL